MRIAGREAASRLLLHSKSILFGSTSPAHSRQSESGLSFCPPGKKIESVLALSRMAIQFSEAGVRMAYPEADEREVFLRTAARCLSRDLMIRAYGWDPNANEDPSGRL